MDEICIHFVFIYLQLTLSGDVQALEMTGNYIDSLLYYRVIPLENIPLTLRRKFIQTLSFVASLIIILIRKPCRKTVPYSEEAAAWLFDGHLVTYVNITFLWLKMEDTLNTCDESMESLTIICSWPNPNYNWRNRNFSQICIADAIQLQYAYYFYNRNI